MPEQRKDDGGPAFPVAYSNEKDGPTIMPTEGMTLRDYLAIHANIGDVDQITRQCGEAILKRPMPLWDEDPVACLSWWAEVRAAHRYIEADAMLKERSK